MLQWSQIIENNQCYLRLRLRTLRVALLDDDVVDLGLRCLMLVFLDLDELEVLSLALDPRLVERLTLDFFSSFFDCVTSPS